MINAAKTVAFLDTDGSKADTLRRVLEGPPGEDMLPAAKVRSADGIVHCFLTGAEAGTVIVKTAQRLLILDESAPKCRSSGAFIYVWE